MPFLSKEDFDISRKYVLETVKKPETFLGLVLFMFCSKKIERNGTYIISDMQEFSELIDKSFTFVDKDVRYGEKFWYGLLSDNWEEQLFGVFFTKKTKILANHIINLLFWYKDFEDNKSALVWFKQHIPNVFWNSVFYENENTDNIYNENNPINRNELLKFYNGYQDKPTIRIDGSFIVKRAGDLSASSYSQTLYAANEIKKIIWLADFDFLQNFSFLKSQESFSLSIPSSFTSLPKPFLILAGISGTGKSRFVRKQAEMSGGEFKLIPVRPDWHEPSELLGYPSYLGDKPTYHTTEFLQFLFSAWQAILPNAQVSERGIQISAEALSQIKPFWLCLDEMNLAPVEQYFADYLAVIESREWCWENDQAEYRCDPLIPASIFNEFDEQFDLSPELLAFFQQHGMPLPFNLIVAGTVNMDETTHGFSRKVLDRALSFDFSEFYPNDFAQYFENLDMPVALSYPIYSAVSQSQLPEIDHNGQKSIALLSALNQIFDQTPFKLGYRALNELLLSIVCFNPQDDAELQAVWDDFLMFKVLPRLEGDEDKLAFNEESNLLQALLELLPTQFNEIWEGERKDFLRKRNEQVIQIACRSKIKLNWMQKKLERLQFTTFWQ